MSIGWDLIEGGGLLDDADCTIEKAYFGYDAMYSNGEQLVLILEGTSPQAEEGRFRQFYSIGRGWDTSDRGATIEGRDAINKTSNYGMFIAAAEKVMGAEKLHALGSPGEAKIWEGLTFHMERVPVVRKIGGEEQTSEILLPTALVSSPNQTAPTSAPAEDVKPSGNGGGPALKAKLIVMARKADDFDAFLTDALTTYPDIESDTALYAEVLDDEAGIWAQK